MSSYVIRNKKTGTVIAEAFSPEVIRAFLQSGEYEVIPIHEYLAEVNRAAKTEAAQ